MLQHVYERAGAARSLDKLIVATDDARIASEVRRFGGEVRMTRPDHPSGTDRVAEAAAAEPAPWVVNIQGDEPLLEPAAIDAAVAGLLDRPQASMGTLAKRIEDPRDLDDPNVVKVVTDRRGEALYFSRSTIPFSRGEAAVCYRHIGLYVYRCDFLLSYPSLPVGPLERAEKLEQLRALENGYRIHVAETDYECVGVDTPEDLERVSKLLESRLLART